jgi:hypothetical protein
MSSDEYGTGALRPHMNSEHLADIVREQALDVFDRMFRAVELVFKKD